MSELANRSVSLEDVLGPSASELAGRIADAPSPGPSGSPWSNGRWRRASPRRRPPTPAWRGRSGVLARSGGRAAIGGLAGELGWSHRRLIARFRDAVGMPPKRVARILRFERLTALIGGRPRLRLGAGGR